MTIPDIRDAVQLQPDEMLKDRLLADADALINEQRQLIDEYEKDCERLNAELRDMMQADIDRAEGAKETRAKALPLGYLCATAIVIAMLYFDGAVAIATAAGVAGSMAGLTYLQRRDANE